MNHLLNFSILACLLLPFINQSTGFKKQQIISSREQLNNLLNIRNQASNQDTLSEQIHYLQSRIAAEEIKPAILKWIEHITEFKNTWLGFELLNYFPIALFLVLCILNIYLALKSDVKTTFHQIVLWSIPVNLFSLLLLESPYELMIGYWLAFVLSSFKVFRMYNA